MKGEQKDCSCSRDRYITQERNNNKNKVSANRLGFLLEKDSNFRKATIQRERKEN